LAPFAATPLPHVDAVILPVLAMIFVNNLITSSLLFSQFSIVPSRSLLALASGYLFAALIAIPHALSIPGGLAPTGLLGAGSETAAWLYVFWHMGFALGLIVYAWLKDEYYTNTETPDSTLSAVGWSVAIVVCLVFGLTWITTARYGLLPTLFLSRTNQAPLAHYIALLIFLMNAMALALLWTRRRSVLDLWLMVVACALMMELLLVGLFSNVRFSLGFYFGPIFSLITATIVLVILLVEAARLYARLAHSNMMLRRQQNNKLINIEAMAASIAHEVRQPLAAIVMNGSSALRFLGMSAPNLEEARSSLNAIVRDGHRASEVFESIRALVRSSDRGMQPIDVNEIIPGALRILRADLNDHGVTTRIELTSELPLVMGHKGQLQEVLLNLASNAIEAMDVNKEGSRVLRLKTEQHGRDAIAVSVEDSGPGIDPEAGDDIFDCLRYEEA
jgi:signal transduction histidine kinase